jgi:hypothetical protein
MRHALVVTVVVLVTACSPGSDSESVGTTAAPSPTAAPEDFNEQWCDSVDAFRSVLDQMPTLNRDPQLVAAAEGVESDLNRLSDDLEAGGQDDLAGQVGALSVAVGDIAEVLDTKYDSVTDALKNAIEDQNDALDKLNAALDAFPKNAFGTC